jgi:hypothetical protein
VAASLVFVAAPALALAKDRKGAWHAVEPAGLIAGTWLALASPALLAVLTSAGAGDAVRGTSPLTGPAMVFVLVLLDQLVLLKCVLWPAHLTANGHHVMTYGNSPTKKTEFPTVSRYLDPEQGSGSGMPRGGTDRGVTHGSLGWPRVDTASFERARALNHSAEHYC